MFLLVSVRHVGAHPDELQHGVSIQSSINLGKTFPRISRIRIITSFHIPDSGLYLSNGFDFDFDLFWMAWHWKPAIDVNVMLYLYTRLITNYPFFKDFNLSSKKYPFLNNIDPFLCRLISAFIFQNYIHLWSFIINLFLLTSRSSPSIIVKVMPCKSLEIPK